MPKDGLRRRDDRRSTGDRQLEDDHRLRGDHLPMGDRQQRDDHRAWDHVSG